MKISLFGKNLFEVKKSQGEMLFNTAVDTLNKSAFLIDFFRDLGNNSFNPSAYISINGSVTEIPATMAGGKIEKMGQKEEKPKLSPKDVYVAKMLNEVGFKIKTDPKYIDEQIQSFKDKLGMIKSEEYDMNRGTIEIQSIVSRMENRKKYAKFNSFYDEFPYTTSNKIGELIKEHDYLQIGQIAQFVADLPKEATDVMKAYTNKTKELCDKKPVFYIIADKKDFEKTTKRRDPILLAQSPFGHFWQILGAWDKEMLLIEEL